MSLFKKVWKWTLSDDFSIDIPYGLDIPDFENKWIVIKDGVITVKKGYSWDGCSPKIRIFGVTIGTWDGFIDKEIGVQKCYYASLIHDILYQFNIGKRSDADKFFLYLLYDMKFELSFIYYTVIRSIGWIFWIINYDDSLE